MQTICGTTMSAKILHIHPLITKLYQAYITQNGCQLETHCKTGTESPRTYPEIVHVQYFVHQTPRFLVLELLRFLKLSVRPMFLMSL